MLKSYESLGNPAAFSGINNLERVLQKKRDRVKKELESINLSLIHI